jgi:hypothetical protein
VRDNLSVTEFQNQLAASHNNIAKLQWETGDSDPALETYAKELMVQERLAREHPESRDNASDLAATLNNMAMIDLAAKRFQEARKRLQQAISWQKKALAAYPMHPIYRQFLGNHLRNLVEAAKAIGKDDEARVAQRELDELAATDPAKIALDQRLAAAIRGEAPKDNRERLQLAYRAYEKKLYAASTRLFGDALDANAKLADDRRVLHRYNAACAAALAAAERATPTLPSPIEGEEKTGANAAQSVKRGEIETSSPVGGEDRGGRAAPPLTDADRARLRSQAHAWLEAELATWTRLLESANAQQRQTIDQTLKHWQQDTDLASVRDEAALAKLRGEEHKAWKSLWGNVDALLLKARKP